MTELTLVSIGLLAVFAVPYARLMSRLVFDAYFQAKREYHDRLMTELNKEEES